MSTVKAIAARAGRSLSKRQTSSAAKCCASAAEPPLPQLNILLPFFKAAVIVSIAAVIGLLRASFASCFA